MLISMFLDDLILKIEKYIDTIIEKDILSYFVTVDAAILGVVVPVMNILLDRLEDKYNGITLKVHFDKISKKLVWCLIANLAFIYVLKIYYYLSDIIPDIKFIGVFIVVFSFIVVSSFIILYKTGTYMITYFGFFFPEKILNNLMDSLFKDSVEEEKSNNKYEKINDIKNLLVYLVKFKRDDPIEEVINKFNTIWNKVINKKNKLDVYELYVTIQIFDKVSEESIKCENYIVYDKTLFFLKKILKDLTTIELKDNTHKDVLYYPNIRYLIDILNNRSKLLANSNFNLDEEVYQNDRSRGFKYTIQYLDIIFEPNFNNKWIDLFKEKYFEIIEFVIKQDKYNSFSIILDHLSSEFTISYKKDIIYINQSMDNLSRLLYIYFIRYKINDNISEILSEFERVRDFNQLDSFIINLKNKYGKFNEEEFNKIEVQFKIHFKYKIIYELSFSIGSYCIFKRKYHLIKTLWNSNPSINEYGTIYTKLGNSEIGLLDINALFKVYYCFKRTRFGDSKYIPEKFYLEYLALNIIRLLNYNIKLKDYFDVNQFDYNELERIKESKDKLIETCQNILDRSDLLKDVSIVINDKNNFQEEIKDEINALIEKVENKLSNMVISEELNSNIIKLFKENSLNYYNNKFKLKNIYEKFNNYIIESQSSDDKDIIIVNNNDSINNQLFDSVYFKVENKYREFYRLEEAYVNLILDKEESTLLRMLYEKTSLTNESLESILDNKINPDKAIILLVNIPYWNVFNDLNKYTIKLGKSLDTNNDISWIEYKNQKINFYGLYAPNSNAQIIFTLNKEKKGKLYNLNPANSPEEEKFVKGIFYFKIEDLASNKDLRKNIKDELLKNPHQKQTSEELEKTLKLKVFIEIREKIKFDLSDFEGYKILFN